MILRSSTGMQVLIPGDLSLRPNGPTQMTLLRRLLYETSVGRGVYLLSDAAVLSCLQKMMSNGEVTLVREFVRKPQSSGGGAPAPASAAAPPPSPAAAPAPRQQAREVAPDPDTFDSPPDAVIQAGVLAAAAASGSAFCET
jgi:hypothetical protein